MLSLLQIMIIIKEKLKTLQLFNRKGKKASFVVPPPPPEETKWAEWDVNNNLSFM